MRSFGETIRELREAKGLPLRIVSAFLDIDQAILSKIERAQRMASRDQVVKLATFFSVSENDLLVSWLSDKLVYQIADEEMALKALEVAEEKISYQAKSRTNISVTIDLIRSVLRNDGRVSSAWLFGSLARGEEKIESDIDIMVELNNQKTYSMFDLIDIAHLIEQKINRKVDLVEKGFLKDFALKTAEKDLIQIYG